MPRSASSTRTDGTRPRVLAMLREGVWTVDDLAARLELTDNAVRFHLEALEREGIVKKEGLRRTGGVGQPATMYSLTAGAEESFSRAYAPVLIAALEELRDQMSRPQLMSFLKRVGRRLSGQGTKPSGSLSSRIGLIKGDPFERRRLTAASVLEIIAP